MPECLQDVGGVMALSDVYCRINRARGIEVNYNTFTPLHTCSSVFIQLIAYPLGLKNILKNPKNFIWYLIWQTKFLSVDKSSSLKRYLFLTKTLTLQNVVVSSLQTPDLYYSRLSLLNTQNATLAVARMATLSLWQTVTTLQWLKTRLCYRVYGVRIIKFFAINSVYFLRL